MKKVVLLVTVTLFAFKAFASSFAMPIELDSYILLNDEETVSEDDNEDEKSVEEAGDSENVETETDSSSKDTISDNDSANEEVSKDEASIVTEEKALQEDGKNFFPTPIEEKEEEPLLLTSIDILKELDDASHLFDNATLVAQKSGTPIHSDDSTSKPKDIEEDTVHEEIDDIEENIENDPNYLALNEDGQISTPNEEIIDEPEPAFIDDSFIDDSDNSIDDFMIDIDERVGEQIENIPNDPHTSVDSEDFLTFDEEQRMEEEKNNLQQNPNVKEEDIEAKGELSSIVEEDDKVNISRYTDIVKGQNIAFSYPGEGWVYLGEENSKRGLNYERRKMQDGKTNFTFNAEEEGNYVLNFSYFDVFSGDFIVDAVSVKVLPNTDKIKKDVLVLEYPNKENRKDSERQEREKKTPNEVNIDADKVRIRTQTANKKRIEENKEATSGAEGRSNKQEKKENEVPKNDVAKENASKENINKERIENEKIQPASKRLEVAEPKKDSFKQNETREPSIYKEPEVFANVATLTPENAKGKNDDEVAKKMIGEAQEAISTGDAKIALEKLNNFFAIASTNVDEAYLLRGKAYELNSEFKNIKMALAAYKFLIKTFPNSPHRTEADARIRYIEKFFINIK